MELRQLRYFSEVAAVGTFLGAAERLHVADPGVWKQVRELERELGLPLFDRVGRRVRITRAGTLLLELVDETLASADRVRKLADDLRQGHSGTVIVGCGASHVARFVGPVLARFEQLRPEIHVQLREYQLQTATFEETVERRVGDLVNGTVDLITTPPVDRNFDGFAAFEGHLVAVIPADDPRARAGGVPIQTLADEQLLCLPGNTTVRKLLEHTCRAAGFEPRVKAESLNVSTLITLARSGHGVPVLLDYMLDGIRGATGTPITQDGRIYVTPVWLYWRTGVVLLPAVEAFIAEARAYAQSGAAGALPVESVVPRAG